MTTMEVRKEVKALVISKGLDNIINADLNKLLDRGATGTQLQEKYDCGGITDDEWLLIDQLVKSREAQNGKDL